MRGILLLILLASLASGCNLRQREEAVAQKEKEVAEKEQQLLLREQSLATREEQVLLRERKLDSTLLDSSVLFNPSLPGMWAVKMVCTETTCTGSAVGDTKNESWSFSYQNNAVIVRVMAADKLVRTYNGSYVNSVLELVENVEPTATAPATKMLVRLSMKDSTTMDGLREIVRPDCKIVYSLTLNKTSSPQT